MRLRVLLVLLTLCWVIAAPARAAPGYAISIQPRDLTFSPGAGAVSGHWAVLWSTGAASAGVTTTGSVDHLSVEVDADQCEGAPHLEIALDGMTGLSQEIDGTGVYVVPLDWAPGRHRLTFRFLDDHRTAACDRNVRFRAVSLSSRSSDPGPYTFQQLSTRYVDIAPVTAGNATNQRAKLWNDGSMQFRLDSHGTTYLVLTIVVTPCGDRRPDVTVTVDGTVVVSGPARAGRTNLGLDGRLRDGPHDIVLRMSRDANVAGCDGNVALTSALFDGNVLIPSAPAAERFEATLRPGDFSFSPGAGRASERSVILWSTGAASAYLDTPAVTGSLQFSASAQQCEGAPHLQVAVDGVTRLTQEVDGEGSYGIALDWPAGRHKITFRFLDDHRTATCDRNVLVRSLSLYLPGRAVSLYSQTSLRPEYAAVSPVTAGNATLVRAKLWSNGMLRFRLDSLFASDLYVALVGAGCGGRMADVLVIVDGATVYAGPAPQGEREIAVAGSFHDGGHDLTVMMSHDPNTATCDGNVAVTGAGFAGLLRP